MDIGAKEIRKWHVEEKGWSDIGYHVIICRSGILDGGRPLEIPGAHAKGYNKNSIGIALVGGMSEAGKPECNFTEAQYETLKNMICIFMEAHEVPREQVIGHNQVSTKECPCFDVPTFVRAMYLEEG